MTLTEPTALVGAGIDRVDGPLKVAGAAPYAMDIHIPGMVHLGLVRSTIAAGRVTNIDTRLALGMPGVLAVVTHRNAPTLRPGPEITSGPTPPLPLQDDRIVHYGQYVAAVVAETDYEARAAARAVLVSYEKTNPIVALDDPRAEVLVDPFGTDSERGDVVAAMAGADVVHEATYTTSDNTNNPLGLFATVAVWEGGRVTVYDSTQGTSTVRDTIAQVFALPETSVRVYAKYVGGGFGSGLRTWPHVLLTIIAARMVGRPVKVVLSRSEMFTGVGHRPGTVQRIRLGARRTGELVAIEHEALQPAAMRDVHRERIANVSSDAYDCPNVTVRDQQRRLNIPSPGSMRAPGEAQGNFAIESAIDELSYRLGLDPLELRLRNHAERHPSTGLPWSSNALRQCYLVGAERFGWWQRDPRVGTMRDGRWLVGYGLARVAYPFAQSRCEARATIARDGTGYVRSAATDIGTGTYTVMRQLSAELLGLPFDKVHFDLGDSQMPWSPNAGGSGLTAALGSAIHDACRALVGRFLDLVAADSDSPLRARTVAEVAVTDGRIHQREDVRAGESYAEILQRHGLDAISADGINTPPEQGAAGLARSGAFAAKFVEVRIDPDLGVLRIPRVTSVIDGGRILNEKLARSQIIGGTVGGIGNALFEETATDEGSGRIANANLGDYLVPVNADIGDIDVVFVGGPDRLSPVGVKGVGEVGVSGIAAAIANGVYHATGRRIRSLPISIEHILGLA